MNVIDNMNARAAKRAASLRRNPNLTAFARALLDRIVACGDAGYRVAGTAESLSISNLAKRGYVVPHSDRLERSEYFIATAAGTTL